MKAQITMPKIPTRLKQFEDYETFLKHARSRFALEDGEYEGLYNVLLKLESVGIDPVAAMDAWRRRSDPADLQDFIRFMILVDSMELEALQAVA